MGQQIVSVCPGGELSPSHLQTSTQNTSHAIFVQYWLTTVSHGEMQRRKQKRKQAVGTFGIAEDHMVHGDLKLYWLSIIQQTAVWVSFIKQYFQIQFILTLGVLCICWLLSNMALKYILKICNSNTGKGKVSGHVYESLRRERFSFLSGSIMNVCITQEWDWKWSAVSLNLRLT